MWGINRSPDEFYDYLKDTIIPTFNSTFIDDKLRNYGMDFFNLLFPTDEGEEIRLKFIEYMKKHISTKPIADKEDLPLVGKDTQLLFVRFSENKENLPFIIPLGLVAVDIGNNNKQFIGHHFELETPLKYETFSDKVQCITHWVATLPNTNKLENAYKQIGNSSITDWNSRALIYPNIKSFRGWVEIPLKDEIPTAIMVLAHYGDNILTDGNDMLPSASVLRRFSQPSVAILDGCGTMKPGSTDFIKQLNKNGVMTMIATSTSIAEPMGGDFIQCLGDVVKNIDKEEAKQMTISDVYIKTLNCLHLKKWGVNILRYSLLGDGNLGLCAPRKGGGK